MKRRNEKKNAFEKRTKDGIMIVCKRCDLYLTCNHREKKEKSESQGTITYCTLTPNKRKKG